MSYLLEILSDPALIGVFVFGIATGYIAGLFVKHAPKRDARGRFTK